MDSATPPEQPTGITSRHLLLVSILALLVRLVGLEQQNLWFDEIVTINIARLPFTEFAERLRAADNSKPPLYHTLVHGWMKLGKSDAWLRLTSALPGAAACVIAALLGVDLFSDRRGWWVGILLSISPMHVWYSQELRMYSLLSLCGFSTMWFHLRFLKTQKRFGLFGYGLCAVLTCYTFTYGCFILGFCVLYTLLYRPTPTRPALLQVIAVSGLAFAVFVPWALRIASMAAAGEGFQALSKGPAHEAAGFALFNLGFGSTFGPTMESLRIYKGAIFRAEPLASALMLAGLVLLMAVLACGAVETWRRARNVFWFATTGLLVFWGTPAVLNFIKPQVAYNPRYAILGVLPVALLTVGAVSRGPGRRWRVALVTLFVATMGWSLANHFCNPAYGREDVRGTARIVASMQPAPARVILCPHYLENVYQRYYSGSVPSSGLNLSSPDAREQLDMLRLELAQVERWILIYGRTEYGDPRNLVPDWLAQHFTVFERRKLPGLQIFIVGRKAAPPAP